MATDGMANLMETAVVMNGKRLFDRREKVEADRGGRGC